MHTMLDLVDLRTAKQGQVKHSCLIWKVQLLKPQPGKPPVENSASWFEAFQLVVAQSDSTAELFFRVLPHESSSKVVFVFEGRSNFLGAAAAVECISYL